MIHVMEKELPVVAANIVPGGMNRQLTAGPFGVKGFEGLLTKYYQWEGRV
ncbi:MAG: hypothetical protein AB1441_04180 [Bacillota bacterium]